LPRPISLTLRHASLVAVNANCIYRRLLITCKGYKA